MGQHMIEAKRRGDRGGSLWQVFWKGGSAEGSAPDERSPELAELPRQSRRVLAASIWGMSIPWSLALSTVLGLCLIFAPTLFNLDIRTRAADVGHLGGALIVTVSVICMGEVLRAGRYLNILLGLLVATVPWFLSSATAGYAVSGTIAGLAVVVSSIPRGQKTEQYGLWDPYVR